MIEILEKLQKSRATKLDFPCLFDDTNIQSIYGMLDPTGRGFITLQQYMEGIKTKLSVNNMLKLQKYFRQNPSYIYFFLLVIAFFFNPFIFLNICIHILFFLNVNKIMTVLHIFIQSSSLLHAITQILIKFLACIFLIFL